MEAFSELKTPAFVFDMKAVKRHLRQRAAENRTAITADRKTNNYYRDATRLLWVDEGGVDCRADSLLAWLQLVGEMGMREQAFCVDELERDLRRLRSLDLGGEESISMVAARLEYNLTRACLRYTYGQRYGFVNPRRVFNNLDVEKQDTVRKVVQYRRLFDYDMELPGADFDSLVRHKIKDGSIVAYLREIQPQGDFYMRLRDMLPKADTAARKRILCNMERCRWRLRKPLPESGRRVVVNIPAFHLYALGADSLLDMRVVCGAVSTKTPLIYSAFEWMEINPQWIIPTSILEKEVIRHVGDSAYFARNHYQIYERATNKQIPISAFTRERLLSRKYRVAQQSGADNSLGRIVFRFPNNFQVFLHYTSNPAAFGRASRAMSHGCVRVSQPFELASFLLPEADEWLLDRIRISMDLKPQTEQGRNYLAKHAEEKEHKLISYVPVKSRVPIYIIYYTLWPDEQGELKSWPDVYGYDKVLWQHLQPYML